MRRNPDRKFWWSAAQKAVAETPTSTPHRKSYRAALRPRIDIDS
jgi:hypothetical protein